MSTNAQRLLEAELVGGRFRAGVARGYWSLATPVAQLAWPFVDTWITASPRESSPSRWLVHWDVGNYGSQPNTGGFWDEKTGAFLAPEKWPKGRPGSTVAAVFKTAGWAAPGRGFYHHYDRLAIPGHPWTQDAWTPQVTLTDFMTLVYRWLNCGDYVGQ
ncbi:hypothetical protein MQE22_06940 [Acidithiobacillus sp. YTS05]|nr:hypothetical protein MQE22_06940 [Acidithiobacillus sp. YTS05]